MSLAITPTAPSASPMRSVANLLYRRPNLYLLMLLIPPLIWFGAIYLGSLLTLLWQGFYTFDDFTMAVTPDLTLANFAGHPTRRGHTGHSPARQNPRH